MRTSVGSIWVLLLAPFLSFLSAYAATCPHLETERAALYHRSSFAHGYIHGYEQGFHLGNLDMQLARGPRDVSKSDVYREAADKFRREFGDRHMFRAGYRDGLVVGYTDAANGHTFRAITEARIAAVKLDATQAPEPTASDAGREFELGFTDGYRAGTLQGVGDGRNHADYRPRQAECSSTREGAPLGANYCSAYVRGFGFGYSDGYINHDELMVASKGTGQAVVSSARK